MNPADDKAGKDPIGSVAEEAAKLFALLQQTGAAGSQLWRDPEPVDDEPVEPEPVEPEPVDPEPVDDERPPRHDGAHRSGPECQWCPICQLVRTVRTARPETVEHLAAAAAGVLGSLRSLLDAAADAAREHARPPEGDSGEDGAPSGVDRIDVSEDPDPWD